MTQLRISFLIILVALLGCSSHRQAIDPQSEDRPDEAAPTAGGITLLEERSSGESLPDKKAWGMDKRSLIQWYHSPDRSRVDVIRYFHQMFNRVATGKPPAFRVNSLHLDERPPYYDEQTGIPLTIKKISVLQSLRVILDKGVAHTNFTNTTQTAFDELESEAQDHANEMYYLCNRTISNHNLNIRCQIPRVNINTFGVPKEIDRIDLYIPDVVGRPFVPKGMRRRVHHLESIQQRTSTSVEPGDVVQARLTAQKTTYVIPIAARATINADMVALNDAGDVRSGAAVRKVLQDHYRKFVRDEYTRTFDIGFELVMIIYSDPRVEWVNVSGG